MCDTLKFGWQIIDSQDVRQDLHPLVCVCLGGGNPSGSLMHSLAYCTQFGARL